MRGLICERKVVFSGEAAGSEFNLLRLDIMLSLLTNSPYNLYDSIYYLNCSIDWCSGIARERLVLGKSAH